MTTDNRANEPTEAQVEAVARAYDPEAWAARDKYAADGTGTQVELDLMVEYSLGKARAALVAAQSAAPAPSSGVDEGDCWHEANCRCVRENLVDEGVLAEKLKHWIFQYNQERITLKTFARAVSEWLKGQGR